MKHPVCALATPPGRSAVSVIRVSGDDCLEMLSPLLKNRNGVSIPLKEKPRYAHFVKICDGERIVDEALVIGFVKPFSYTGEDSAEIYLHGNPVIQREVMGLLYRSGFSRPSPGEFTRRAFENGKMDLSQAEAVRQIIEARSEYELQKAMALKAGKFKTELLQFRSEIIGLAAETEAELDFSDEDILFETSVKKKNKLKHLIDRITFLLNGARQVNHFRNGLKVVILGPPNAGKSSLLNLIYGQERAIVSEIPGTTRDFLDITIEIDGIPVRFLDTAGIRETAADEIERKGINRSFSEATDADILIFLLDGSVPPSENELVSFEQRFPARQSLLRMILVNKNDILHTSWNQLQPPSGNRLAIPHFFISVIRNAGLQQMYSQMQNFISAEAFHTEGIILSQWQIELFEKLLFELENALALAETEKEPEILAACLKMCIDITAELSGEIQSEDILGRIFSQFCIGK